MKHAVAGSPGVLEDFGLITDDGYEITELELVDILPLLEYAKEAHQTRVDVGVSCKHCPWCTLPQAWQDLLKDEPHKWPERC